MFLDRVAASPDKEAFRSPDGEGWTSITWQETADRVKNLAAGLLALGITSEQRVAIASSTRVEWILADLAIMCAGGATTTIYPSTTPEDVGLHPDRLGHRGWSSPRTTTRWRSCARTAASCPTSKQSSSSTASGDGRLGHDPGRARGEGPRASTRRPRRRTSRPSPRVKPEDAGHAHLHLGHHRPAQGRRADARLLGLRGRGASTRSASCAEDDVQYLWLPLAHSFGKVLEAAQLRIGFATAIDGRVDKIVENLAVVKPTFVAAVPRIFEKVHNKVVRRREGGRRRSSTRSSSGRVGVGREVSQAAPGGPGADRACSALQARASPTSWSSPSSSSASAAGCASSSRARRRCPASIAEFFHAAGILILEGYGLTETSAASFVNRPDKYRFGTVGLPRPRHRGEDRRATARSCITGRGVMRGYHNLPEATAEALDRRRLAPHRRHRRARRDGFLRITDRKKDLIKTSGGKYVAPADARGQAQGALPLRRARWWSTATDRKYFCSALVTLDEEASEGVGRRSTAWAT